MPDALTQIADKVAAPLKVSAIVLPIALILITVVSQADTELIRPDTQISLENIHLPSGTLFTPLLGLKLSVFSFYAIAPLIVFALHWVLLRVDTAADELWTKALRVVGTVLAPLTLFVIMWRFAPYGHARPDDIPGWSAGLGLSYLHAGFLACDTALILYGRLEAIASLRIAWPSRTELLRQIGLALQAFMQAGLLFLAVFITATAGAVFVREMLDQRVVNSLFGMTESSVALVAAVLLGLVSWPIFVALRRTRVLIPLLQSVSADNANPTGGSMSVYSVLLIALVASVILPDLGRPLNFSGARLAAAEPSDVIIAAMIGSAKVGPEDARAEALRLFGRGFNYTGWQFARASFDDTTMSLITLNEADLSGASLIRADMIGSKLQGTKLMGAVLSEADLRGADLTCANVREAADCLKLAQTPKAVQGNDRVRAGPEPLPAAPSASDVCTAPRSGPTLNKAVLIGATLTRADLSGASLRSVDLTKTKDMSGAKFIGADLTEANLSDLKLGDVDLSKSCLCGADLSKAKLENVNLSGAVLRNADLRGATLPANLQGIELIGANLKDAVFTGEAPNLQDANLSNVVRTDDFKPTCRQPTGR